MSQEKYSYVISLGGNCQVAYQLRRMGYRDASYPFDWLVAEDHEKIMEALSSNLSHWVLLENLEERPGRAPDHRTVIDHKYEIWHQHLFPTDKSIEEAYPSMREVLDRRRDRFLALQDRQKMEAPVLFVRTKMTEAQAREMSRLLAEKFGPDTKLLVVNHHREPVITVDLDEANLCMVTIYDENEHTGQRWQGYDPHWDILFRGIKRVGAPIPPRSELIPWKGDPFIRRIIKAIKYPSRYKLLVSRSALFDGCSGENRKNVLVCDRWWTRDGEGRIHLEYGLGHKVTLEFTGAAAASGKAADEIRTKGKLLDVYGNTLKTFDFAGRESYTVSVDHSTRYLQVVVEEGELHLAKMKTGAIARNR